MNIGIKNSVLYSIQNQYKKTVAKISMSTIQYFKDDAIQCIYGNVW